MLKDSFFWLKQPISRKVSGLSATLLLFLFIVIVHSIIKLNTIRLEIHEIAEIDIPLTESAMKLEILQLELHLIMEKIYLLSYQADKQGEAGSSEHLLEKYQQINKEIKKHFITTDQMLNRAVINNEIVNDLSGHQQTQDNLAELHTQLTQFNSQVLPTLANLNKENLSTEKWLELEQGFEALDTKLALLLVQVEVLLEDTAAKAEEHVDNFMFINIALGIGALVLGIYLSIYIITSIQARISQLYNKLGVMEDENKMGISHLPRNDEFSKLYNHIQSMIDDFTQELNEKDEVEKKLLRLAITDKLTGAYNRHKWDEVIDTEIKIAQRGDAFSVIAFDLDHFKLVNDKFGHGTGDGVLKHLVALVTKQTREIDSLFRLGGEEFVLLVRKVNCEQASIIAEKLRQAIEQDQSDNLPSVTASFGVTEFQLEDSATTIMTRADASLYEAKRRGRNQVVSE